MAETATASDSSFLSPELVSLFVQMGPTLYQGLLGRRQGKEAEKLQQSIVRPTMGIQQGYQKAFGMANQNAESRYMSNQRAVEQGIEQSGTDILGTASQSATSTQDMQSILKKVSEDITKAKGNLGMQAATDYDRRQLALQQAYQTMGGLEQNAWDYNVRQKFEEDAAAAAALETASIQNRARAMQGFGQAASQFLASDAAGDLFDKIGSGRRSSEKVRNQIDAMNGISGSVDDQSIDPVGYVAPPNLTASQMLDITGLRDTSLTTQDAAATAAMRDMMRRQQQEAISRIRIPAYKPLSSQMVTGNLPMGNEFQFPGSPAYNNWAQPAPSYAVPPAVKVNMPGPMSGGGPVTGQLPGGPQVQMPSNPYESGYYGQLPSYFSVGMPSKSTYVPGSITGQLPGNQVLPSANPYQNQMGVFGQTPSSVFDIMNQISLGIPKY